MDCIRIDAILDEHRARTLSAAERSELGAHLEHCARCADAWLGHEMLAADAAPAPRPGFYAELLATVADEPAAPAARRAGPLLALTGLAAAALFAVVVLGLVQIGGEAPQTSAIAAAPAPAADSDLPPATRPGALLADTPIREPAVAGLLAGVHYTVLPAAAPTSSGANRVEVCEFFMFLCPHCYDFEPALRAWQAEQDERVTLVRVPAIFNAVARLHAQAFYTAEVLGIGDALLEPFYVEVHERGNRLDSVAAIRAFFGRHGIDAERFDAQFDSAEVQARLARAEELNRRYRVTATPSLGVNGRYLTNASMTGSNTAMLEVVDALVEDEARELRCDGSDCSMAEVIRRIRGY